MVGACYQEDLDIVKCDDLLLSLVHILYNAWQLLDQGVQIIRSGNAN